MVSPPGRGLADISERIRDVRFTPKSGPAQRRNQCLLSANSGQCATCREALSNTIGGATCGPTLQSPFSRGDAEPVCSVMAALCGGTRLRAVGVHTLCPGNGPE